MIITYAYPGPFYADHVRLEGKGGASPNLIPTRADSYFEFKPNGEAPWTLTIGKSTVFEEIDDPEALIVYSGKSTLCHSGQ